MATSLASALNPSFFDASTGMRSPGHLPPIYIYVEDEWDSIFWRQMFAKYEKDYQLSIKVYQSAETCERGKSKVMSDVSEGRLVLSSSVLVCIDADYDLIIDNYHPQYTDIIRTSPFVITTQYYSAENVLIDGDRLKTIFYRLTLCEHTSIDFDKILHETARTYYQSFLLLLLSIIAQQSDETASDLTINKYNNFLSEAQYDESGCLTDEAQEKIKEFENDYNYLKDANPDGYTRLDEELRKLGYDESNCSCMIQGHGWMDYVAIPILQQIAGPIYSAKVAELTAEVGEDVENRGEVIRQKHNHYANQTFIHTGCVKGKWSLLERITQLIKDTDINTNKEVITQIQHKIDCALIASPIMGIIGGLLSR